MANSATKDVHIGERVIPLSPLRVGGLKRQRDNLELMQSLAGTKGMPDARTLTAMAEIVADAAGLYPSRKCEPAERQRLDAEREVFFSEVDDLEMLTGLNELSLAIQAVMELSNLKKPEGAADTTAGEAASSPS